MIDHDSKKKDDNSSQKKINIKSNETLDTSQKFTSKVVSKLLKRSHENSNVSDDSDNTDIDSDVESSGTFLEILQSLTSFIFYFFTQFLNNFI